VSFCGLERKYAMMAVKDVSKLLADVPKGAWVALSKDEDRVIAYAAELQEVLRKAKEAGENDPIVTRVPEVDGTTLFL
jgi:Glu-tRNA(Gln) amidotransferase subunit E-like FAD-binding protein